MPSEDENIPRGSSPELVTSTSLLGRLIDWLTPQELRDDLTHRSRSNLLVCAGVFSIAALIIFPVVIFPFVYGTPHLHFFHLVSVVVIAAGLACVSVPFIIRRTGSYEIAANVLLGVGFAVVTSITFFTGGPISPALVWLPYITLVAIFLRGPRASAPWAIFSVVLFIGLFWTRTLGYEFQNFIPEADRNLAVFLSFTFATLGTFALAYVYHSIQESLVHDLGIAKTLAEDANRALGVANDDLEVKITSRTAELTELNESLKQQVSERRRAEEQVRHAALHDVLTGLANRALFLNRLEQMLYRLSRRPNSSFAVLFVNVDRFGVVNDSLGHTVGDQILVSIAQRLRQCVRPNDTIARLEGDEFAILLDETHIPEGSLRCAERLHDALAAPHHFDGHEIFTSLSIGIALSSSGFDHPEDMIQASKSAMLRAKAKGKGRYHVYDDSSLSNSTPKLKLETELRRAVHRGDELVLYYQPIIRLGTGKIAGFEALMRWNHPEHGLIPPLEFIPLAEETELIIPMGRWAIQKAAEQLEDWQRRYMACEGEALTMSVNVSSRQFSNEGLVSEIGSILDGMNLKPNTLKLEVTESLLIDNPELAASMFEGLKRLGIHISMDDFGTGYSSLTYLYRYPFDIIKIDRAFVSTMCEKPKSKEIVKTIANLAHGLELDIVAEGIETQAELTQLQALNCEYGQGFFFAKPLIAHEAEVLLKDQRIN